MEPAPHLRPSQLLQQSLIQRSKRAPTESIDVGNDLLLLLTPIDSCARAVLRLLAPRWRRVRIVTPDQDEKTTLQAEFPSVEILLGDILRDPVFRERVMIGVCTCWLAISHISDENVCTMRQIFDYAAASVRTRGAFKHLVYMSVLHPVLSKIEDYKNARIVEEYIIESGVPYTILQAAITMYTDRILSKLTSNSDYDYPTKDTSSNKTPFSLIHENDLAQIIVNVLEQHEKHFCATYQLVGTVQPVSFLDICQMICDETKATLHRSIAGNLMNCYYREPGMRLTNRLRLQRIANEDSRRSYFEVMGLVGNTVVAEMLLGRAPTSCLEWVRATIQEAQRLNPELWTKRKGSTDRDRV